jgi:uncharacterized alkaline shock family protein YloU
MSEELVLTVPEGTVTVPAATLARIVGGAAELAEDARIRRPRRGVDVEVTGGRATVTVKLAARYGAVLPELAEDVQRRVADALTTMCGVEVRGVDVVVEELV